MGRDGTGQAGDQVEAICAVISALPSHFMVDPATYRRGAELGFDGIDFYFGGRAGVLGDTPGPVVAAALVFFEPEHVATSWDRARAVMPFPAAAEAFAGCLVGWAHEHLPAGPDYGRLASLLGRVAQATNPAGAPLFAGWRAVPEPSDPAPLALHRLNVVRELQGARHGCAVLATGLTPLQAVAVRQPHMAAAFGWSGTLPDAGAAQDDWRRAQVATESAMAEVLATLSPTELGELGDLLAAATPG